MARKSHDTSTLGGRIALARQQDGPTGLDLIKRLGVKSESTLYAWQRNESEPSPMQLREIADSYGVRYEWLLTGEGPMLRSEDSDRPVMPPAQGHFPVPVFDGAAAGPGRVPAEAPVSTHWLTAEEYSRTFHRVPGSGNVAYFKVVGDSAAPVYFDGEEVPVELQTRGTEQFQSDNVYVYRWRNDVQLKRLRRREDDSISAYSLNPSVPPFRFGPPAEGEFEVLGRVVGSQKQQLYAAMVHRAIAIQKQVADVIKGSR